jgi:hypothetical protein
MPKIFQALYLKREEFLGFNKIILDEINLLEITEEHLILFERHILVVHLVSVAEIFLEYLQDQLVSEESIWKIVIALADPHQVTVIRLVVFLDAIDLPKPVKMLPVDREKLIHEVQDTVTHLLVLSEAKFTNNNSLSRVKLLRLALLWVEEHPISDLFLKNTDLINNKVVEAFDLTIQVIE